MTSLPTMSPPAVRPFAILFFAEMALSPLVAGTALLVPIAAHWGAYKYVPAIMWCMLLLQCLVTFRWRGLWFLLGLPVAFVAIEAFLVAAPPVPRREAQSTSVQPRLIRQNSDGTLTVQKEPPVDGKGQAQGLRIPPQVIAPMNPTPNKTGPAYP